jgi:hypothetical protein
MKKSDYKDCEIHNKRMLQIGADSWWLYAGIPCGDSKAQRVDAPKEARLRYLSHQIHTAARNCC